MKFFTPGQVAEIMVVSEATVYRWIREGDLAAVRRSRFTRVSAVALERFVESLTVPARKARR